MWPPVQVEIKGSIARAFLRRLLQNPTRPALRAHVGWALARGDRGVPAAVRTGRPETENALHPPQPFGRQAFSAPDRSGEAGTYRCGYAPAPPEHPGIQDCRARSHVGFCKSLLCFSNAGNRLHLAIY